MKQLQLPIRFCFFWGLLFWSFLGGAACSWGQTAAVTVSVDAAQNRHAINPDVYGIVNYGLDAAFAKEIRLPNTRWGGDGTTRYNWQVDASNAGFDWFFMGGDGVASPTPSAGPDAMIKTFGAAGARALITVPIIPYLNKSAAWSCSFPVSVYGAQQSTNPYVHPNGDTCGNSISTSGAQLLDNNTYANHIDNSPMFQQNWIEHFLLDFGKASAGGVSYYQLDNEPGGWGNTHRDVLPNGASYDTIFSLGSEYAAMIKSTDATAQVMGPSDFTLGGWIGTSADMQEHGNLYAGQWYLQQMQAYQAQHGTRVLDYFDEHVYGGSETDNSYELQSTRSLWDASYNSGTWIEQYYFGNMQLIPRFKGWVNQYYPGTKLAFSEYSWGQHGTLYGALAEADILGIFGQQGVDFADMWDPPKPTDPTAYAFRLYRDFDGQGGSFGETSVSAKSSDVTQVTVYAAQRTSDNALTLVVINKTANALTPAIGLANFMAQPTASVYTYSGANLQQITPEPAVAVVNGSVTVPVPAQSATVVVVPQSTGPLARTGWKATASSTAGGNYGPGNQQAGEALDGNGSTRWSTGRQQTGGEWFEVDMGAPQSFSSLSLDAGASKNDYPRGYQVFVSADGKSWGSAVASGQGATALVNIHFPRQTARYLKVVQTGKVASWWWSIAELNVNP